MCLTILKNILPILLLPLIFQACADHDVEEVAEFDGHYPLKDSYSEDERSILDLINTYRTLNNLNRLDRLNIISSVALSHTNHMVDTNIIDHYNFLNRRAYLMEQLRAIAVGEIIAHGYHSPISIVNAWKESTAHNTILLGTHFTHFGIAMKKDELNKMTVTQMFIEKDKD